MGSRFITEEEILKRREEFGIKQNSTTENYDPRPLWEKLQEKHDKEQEEFSQRMKPKPPKALDDEEYFFLKEQEEKQNIIKKQVEQEDEVSLAKFREEQSKLSLLPTELQIEVKKENYDDYKEETDNGDDTKNKEEIKSTSMVSKKRVLIKTKKKNKNTVLPIKVITKESDKKKVDQHHKNFEKIISEHKQNIAFVVQKNNENLTDSKDGEHKQ